MKEARDNKIYPIRPRIETSKRDRRLFASDREEKHPDLLYLLVMPCIFIVAVYTFVKIQTMHLKSVISGKLIIKMNGESEVTLLL